MKNEILLAQQKPHMKLPNLRLTDFVAPLMPLGARLFDTILDRL